MLSIQFHSFLVAVTLWVSASAVTLRRQARKLANENPADGIPGQFMVELYPQYNPHLVATGLLNSLINGNSPNKPQITFYYDYVMNGFAVTRFPEERLQGLLNNPQVKTVWRVSKSNTLCCLQCIQLS
jgi:hypothetical protein